MSYSTVATKCAIALVSLVILGGCTLDSSTPTADSTSTSPPTPSATPTVAPAPPPTSACYQLSLAEALAPTNLSTPVPCRRKWTSRTFYVGRLDLVTDDGHLLGVDSSAAQAQVSEVCPQRLASYLGGTTESQRLSVLRSIWFTPTIAEADSGADWFRCDVVALSGRSALARLTGRLRNALDAEDTPYALCGTAKPGSKDFERVSCSQDHTWRAVKTVELVTKSYPGTKRARAAGVVPCTDAARENAQDALDFQWGYQWPTKKQWDGTDGRPPQRYGICWSPADGS